MITHLKTEMTALRKTPSSGGFRPHGAWPLNSAFPAFLGYRGPRPHMSTPITAKGPEVFTLTIFRFIDFPSIRTFLHNRCSRSIRPFANRNHELGDRLRTVAKLRIQGDWRVGQIRTPG
jgi:hypothetical protein